MRILFILIITLSTFALAAQDGKHSRHERSKEHKQMTELSYEKIEAQKVAFFTTQLDLSPKEAQEFWPIYNEYSKKKKELREIRKQKPNLDNIDDAQANVLLENMLNNKQNELDLNRTYVEKFKQVLVPQKVIQLFMLERKFKEEVLKDVRRRLNQPN